MQKLLSELSEIFKIDMPTTLCCDLGHVIMKYVPTTDMIADLFTKSLARVKFQGCLARLGLVKPRSA
jgi:hypothetical protein